MDKRMKVVVAGGGTAGWLAATAFARQMGTILDITLVESESIGTVGVGESTIPPMKTFHRLLNINEQEFMKESHATFKLGIMFENWKNVGDKYIHAFGSFGRETLITEFVHFWLKGKSLSIAGNYGDYCLEHKAAELGRCSVLGEPRINQAYHLDSALYAKYLRKISEAEGVKRIEGKIRHVVQNAENGFIKSLQLESGLEIEGDLFIDCTGFQGLLIEKTLHTGFEDWSHWLPCDRAIAVQTESVGDPVPYTRSIAHHAGWRWRIPLQHRVGNGIVYSSCHMSDDEAVNKLLTEVEGNTLIEPRVIPFRTGKRRKNWNKNCIALGLATGFLEPLESTSIHLVMSALARILQLFPTKDMPEVLINEYNNQAASEIEKIRDFIILHYHVTNRDDSSFWQYCRNMDVPEELAHRIRLFREMGKSYQVEGELFRLNSWVQVMLGQGITPEQYHPIVDAMKPSDLKAFLDGIRSSVSRSAEAMPMHNDFIQGYCKAAL